VHEMHRAGIEPATQ